MLFSACSARCVLICLLFSSGDELAGAGVSLHGLLSELRVPVVSRGAAGVVLFP